MVYSPVSTLGVTHGHSAIYYTSSNLMEAPGPGYKSRLISASDLKVWKGAVKQTVKTTSAKRINAAAHSRSTYMGRAYNILFGFNKTGNGPMNCSQLVWAAYKEFGVDIDGNGGHGVYPSDIKDSSLTTTYKTF